MISTWGIFWICFFSYLTLKVVIHYFFTPRWMKRLTPEQKEKTRNWIKETLIECSKNINVKIELPEKVKVSKKKK